MSIDQDTQVTSIEQEGIRVVTVARGVREIGISLPNKQR